MIGLVTILAAVAQAVMVQEAPAGQPDGLGSAFDRWTQLDPSVPLRRAGHRASRPPFAYPTVRYYHAATENVRGPLAPAPGSGGAPPG